MPLADKNVQPVWLEIDNREEKEFFLMLLSIDPEYFSPSEVAWMFRKQDDDSLEDRVDILASRHIPVVIPAKSTVSGYVYTNLDPGAKAFAVELFTEKDLRSFEFAQLVPGFEADFMRVDFDKIHPQTEARDLSLAELRLYLEALPCCVSGVPEDTWRPSQPGDCW